MNKIMLAASLLAFMPMGAAFAQTTPTADQCSAWFAKADANGDGSLGKDENTQFVDMMNKTATTKMSADTAMPKDAFLDACQKGTLGMPPA